MNEEKPVGAKVTNTDELTRTQKPGDVQLTEEDLSKASGGVSDISITKVFDKSSPML